MKNVTFFYQSSHFWDFPSWTLQQHHKVAQSPLWYISLRQFSICTELVKPIQCKCQTSFPNLFDQLIGQTSLKVLSGVYTFKLVWQTELLKPSPPLPTLNLLSNCSLQHVWVYRSVSENLFEWTSVNSVLRECQSFKGVCCSSSCWSFTATLLDVILNVFEYIFFLLEGPK